MIQIDGSFGEGGGQVLRTSLTLSILTGKPFRIYNIRANRAKPGLMAQHLVAVKAAAEVSHASVQGAAVGSKSLTFTPSGISPGNFRFDIGTAGATSLVLHTIFIPLALAREPSTVTITGGTHVPWAPCYHYLELQWLPYLRLLGFEARLELVKAGFYPQGGGDIRATIYPAQEIKSLRLLERGPLKTIKGISAVANLDFSVAERQRRQTETRLSGKGLPHEIEVTSMPAHGKSTMLLLQAEFEFSRACYYALGEKGKPAERVADEAVDALFHFLETNGVFDQHLPDQIILPLALANDASEFRTPKVTQHLVTNLEVIRKFLEIEGRIEGEIGKGGIVYVRGRKL